MDKDFDCVEMKRKGQEALRERLKGMTREQELEYWRKRSVEMAEWKKRLLAQRLSV